MFLLAWDITLQLALQPWVVKASDTSHPTASAEQLNSEAKTRVPTLYQSDSLSHFASIHILLTYSNCFILD